MTKNFPLFIQSKTDLNTCFVFRSDGRELKVNLSGHEPYAGVQLTPEEVLHIKDNYMVRELTLNSSING